MVQEDLRPSRILTREAFENAIVVNTALGGSTNCPIHLTAIARHAGVTLGLQDWQTIGYDIPLLVNCQPAGIYLGESFHKAGGVPAVMRELLARGKLHGDCFSVAGQTIGEDLKSVPEPDRTVIHSYEKPLREKAGFLVLSGNLFEGGLIKTCVISDTFRKQYLSTLGEENSFKARCIVFEGPEDYHARIDDPALEIDTSCLLAIRGCGPVGYPGSAEVVNMQPPAELIKKGVDTLPTMGDGRQSGTAASPSILNISPESAVGGNLALLETGDTIRVDLNTCSVELQVNDTELARRRAAYTPPKLDHQTPWQEIYRGCVGQLVTGGCLELATKYRGVGGCIPRRNH
jgi:dihydroxy-acid dehydratase